MDSLNYYYFAGTNRLRGVMDNQITEPYENDINFMSTIDIYTYNERGDMIQDNMEKIYVDWLVNGKIKGVRRFATVADLPDLEFKYDAMGNRISKLVKTRTGTDIDYENEWRKTYYVRDAQGNVLATYDRTWQGFTTPGYTASDQLKITEQHLYGSSRVGVNRANKITASRNYTVGAYGANGITVQYNYASSIDYTAPNPVRTRYETGRRNYELSNHLGNVLAVVTDNVLARIENPPAPGVLRFVPHIVQANDYYPFGSIMPGRSVNSGGYRYGFNGMEKDDEVKGTGNSYDFGARMYDSRIGRWLSVDPLFQKYVSYSPYIYALGNPILFIDPDGRDVDLSKLTSPYHMMAFAILSESKAFKSSILRFMKAGQTITIPGSSITITADIDGDRSNDRLFFVTQDNLLERTKVNGATLSYIKGTDVRLPISNPEEHGTTLNPGVDTRISIDDMADLDEAIRVIGHEQMVHADQDADRLTEIDKLAKDGQLTYDLYIDLRSNISVDGKEDHKKLKEGKLKKHEQVFKEIERPDLYERDKEAERTE